jgi:hypothetical protein
MSKIYHFLVLIAFFSSCKMSQTVFSIDSGGINKQIKSNNLDSLISENETFVAYSKDNSLIINPSNSINYIVYKKVSAPKVKVSSPKVSFDLTKTKKEKKQKGKREKTKRVKTDKVKPKYAYVNISKSFYKINYLNLINDILAIPMVIPTYGQSILWINPIKQKDYFIAKKCSHPENCNGNEHRVNKTILIETDIIVKNDAINDNVVIIENLPKSIKVNNYKILQKKGSSLISEIKYEEKTLNGKKYHQFTIIPKISFTKNCRVWIKLGVTLTPTEQDLASVGN